MTDLLKTLVSFKVISRECVPQVVITSDNWYEPVTTAYVWFFAVFFSVMVQFFWLFPFVVDWSQSWFSHEVVKNWTRLDLKALGICTGLGNPSRLQVQVLMGMGTGHS